jgi:3-phenylpropionate/trans-cinnamate dioxygenase ferredoxin reductase subunit
MTDATPLQAADYLLIGGGLASATAAKEIRKRDPGGNILIAAGEPELPYHRPPLSKEYLRGAIGAEGIYGKGGVYVHRRHWYDEQRIVVLRGVTARELDTTAQRVHLADGRAVHYRLLLLATGGRARRLRVPGADLPGVYLLRTLADANALRAQFSVPGKRVVIVGCGFIGLETAAGAMMQGAQVTMIDSGDRFWPRLIPPNLSAYVEDQFARRGAHIRHQRTVTGFVASPDGRLAAVRIGPTGPTGPTETPTRAQTGTRRDAPADGSGLTEPSEEIPCDLAIAGIGIELNTELAASAGLEVDPRHGIVVDERLETRVAGVFAAGDVAAYPDPLAGRMHFEHWDHAIQSGQVAAANMAGGDEPYRHVPYFFSDQFEYSINMLGYPSSDAQVVIRGELPANCFTAFYLEQGALRAAFMLNDDAHMDLLRAWIASSASFPDPQRLADPTVPLATVAPAPT